MDLVLKKIGEMGGVVEHFISEHGNAYRGRELPKKYERGPARMCFMTCANMAMRDRRLTYVEGFGAIASLGDFPMHHAWLLDKCNRVIEPTWEGGKEINYIGVKIATGLLTDELYRTKNYGVLYHKERANESFLARWIKANAT